MNNINEAVLKKVDAIAEENTVENSLKTTETSKHLNYTPVNAETFKIWCDQYKERLRIEREKNATGIEDKPTGRQLFERNKQAFEDLTLEGMEESFDTTKVMQGAVEESKDEEDDEEAADFQYDKALYAEGDAEEDIDFD